MLEAFHWGRWTSGTWSQGLWLLLVPFGAVNAAQFVLPPPGRGAARGVHALCGALLRTVALVLTALFALAAALVVVDLTAWQAAGRRRAAAGPGRGRRRGGPAARHVRAVAGVGGHSGYREDPDWPAALAAVRAPAPAADGAAEDRRAGPPRPRGTVRAPGPDPA
ncbi:hypothetical protein [Geodermatophilus marinus]|uniref:hypothetical protein n=1 Tax=Geodermatophilus sp. LHW52908 TaxID=2303986 RepID=UPI000E3D2AE0|nr:hypothetical protein [Geodermatophilus sp. LHW52908]RFU19300.1 hypothetical protein D0Z06_22225 [Geodermatophilus sp. LHW52908]